MSDNELVTTDILPKIFLIFETPTYNHTLINLILRK